MKRRAGTSLVALFAAGAWITGCNVEKLFDARAEARGLAPFAPAELGQYRDDGVGPIAPGETIGATAVHLRATVGDPDADDSVRLEIELRVLATPFEGMPTHASDPAPAGDRPTVAVAGLDDSTAYHWQARAVDRTGLASPWVAFGTNADSEPDFGVRVARPPVAPGGIGQFRGDGTTAIPVSGNSGGSNVVLKGTVNDPDPGDVLTFEVEVRGVGTAFSNVATHSATGLTAGAEARVTAVVLPLVAHHWQARTCDARECSAWMPFGGNPESQADVVGSLVAGVVTAGEP